MPTNAAAEVMASLRWCQASAWTAVLPTSCPTRCTRRKSVSFTSTTATSTTSVKGAGPWCGVTISRTAWIPTPTAAPMSSSPTTDAASASALP